MSDLKIMATVTYSVQISIDHYGVKRISRGFAVNRPIKDVLKWANLYLPQNEQNDISRIEFGQYTGDSI